nr:SDR family NAD(P)-dependent oxidoreductase [Sciscionella marina]
MNWAGARVLITGASSGIGAELARLLARRGAHILAAGRTGSALHGHENFAGDLAEPGACVELAAAVGDVDVFIGNAGFGYAGDFAAMPTDRIGELITVNLTANMLLTRALLPGMLDRGHGALAYITSIAGAMAVAEEAAYSGAKAGMATFAESVRLAARPKGVRVTTVVPGVVDTAFFERRGAAYDRSRPRPVAPQRVAEATIAAIERGRAEVFVPSWLRFPARLGGAAPGLVRALRSRFE